MPTPPSEPARVAAQAAGEQYYQSAAPCGHGHTALRQTKTGRCEACRLETQARHKAKLGRPPRYVAHQDPAQQAAVAAGERTYISATPCPHGHRAPRAVATGRCSECLATTLRKSKARPESRARVLELQRLRRGVKCPGQRGGQRGPRPAEWAKSGRKPALVTLDGELVTLPTACERTGVPHQSVCNAVHRRQTTHQEAFDQILLRRRLRELRAELPEPTAPPKKKRGLLDASGHYIDKEKMRAELIACQARGRVNDRLGAMFLLLARRLFLRRNFAHYSCRAEFEDAAVMQMLSAAFKFDPTRGTSPFSYFTSVARNAGLAVLKAHKAQWAIEREAGVLAEIDLEIEAAGATTRRRVSTGSAYDNRAA